MHWWRWRRPWRETASSPTTDSWPARGSTGEVGSLWAPAPWPALLSSRSGGPLPLCQSIILHPAADAPRPPLVPAMPPVLTTLPWPPCSCPCTAPAVHPVLTALPWPPRPCPCPYSPEGQDYLTAMACAANYAWVNRSSMTFLARQVGQGLARALGGCCHRGLAAACGHPCGILLCCSRTGARAWCGSWVERAPDNSPQLVRRCLPSLV